MIVSDQGSLYHQEQIFCPNKFPSSINIHLKMDLFSFFLIEGASAQKPSSMW